MQPFLKVLLKDIVALLLDLDINIYVPKNDTTEKGQFNYVVSAIKYYLSIKPSKHAKSIFFWLVGQSLLVKLLTDPNCTKSKNCNKNGNVSNVVDIENEVDNEIPWADRLFLTNVSLPMHSNRTESKN